MRNHLIKIYYYDIVVEFDFLNYEMVSSFKTKDLRPFLSSTSDFATSAVRLRNYSIIKYDNIVVAQKRTDIADLIVGAETLGTRYNIFLLTDRNERLVAFAFENKSDALMFKMKYA